MGAANQWLGDILVRLSFMLWTLGGTAIVVPTLIWFLDNSTRDQWDSQASFPGKLVLAGVVLVLVGISLPGTRYFSALALQEVFQCAQH